MKLEIGNKMMDVSFEPITVFSRGQASRLMSRIKDDQIVVVMKHGIPIAAITKVIGGDLSKIGLSLTPGIIPLDIDEKDDSE